MASILIANEVNRLETKPVPEADDKILIVDNIEGTLKNGRAESIAALVPSATETTEGIARLATTAEAEAGVEDTQIMTPLKVAQAIAAQEADTFQEVYDKSLTTPQITTNDTLKALQIQRGSAADTDLLLECKNGAGTTTLSVDGNGDLSSNSLNTNAVTATTVDTGQGANELYAMNQDVQTTDNVTFNNITPTGTVDGRDVATDGAKLDTIESGAQVNTVDSVNAQTGAVVLDTDDVSEGTTNLYNRVPAGGTADQVLSKVDGTDYNVQWGDASSGGFVPLTTITASGSIIDLGTAFDATYDIFKIVINNLQIGTNRVLRINLNIGNNSPVTSANYYEHFIRTRTSTSTVTGINNTARTFFELNEMSSSASASTNAEIIVYDPRDSSKNTHVQGTFVASRANVATDTECIRHMGTLLTTQQITGFRLTNSGNTAFTGGTITVWGLARQ